MDVQHITDTVLPIFEAHKNQEDIEIEIRIGKHNGTLFDTNVGIGIWERVLQGLRKFQGWEDVKTTVADVYYNDSNKVRITVDEETGERVMVQKIGVTKEDFRCNPLDVRFSVSREIPTTGEYEMDRKRTKTRHSFIRKNLSIDMTVSSGDVVDMDSEDNASYQIELEIIKPSEVDSVYTLFNILNKIDDLTRLVFPSEKNIDVL
jgi:hypothetical protein